MDKLEDIFPSSLNPLDIRDVGYLCFCLVEGRSRWKVLSTRVALFVGQGIHIRLNERSRYGYDVAVRIGDGRASTRWDSRVQKERVALPLWSLASSLEKHHNVEGVRRRGTRQRSVVLSAGFSKIRVSTRSTQHSTLNPSLFALWQTNRKRRAFPFFTLSGDGPLMFFDDAFDHGQPQSGSLAEFLRRKERVEDFLDHIHGNAMARIGYREFHHLFFRCQADS